MKKIKILFAIISVIAMIGMVSFAATDSSINFTADGTSAEIIYSDLSSSLDVTIYSNSNVEVDAGCYFLVNYDASLWTWTSTDQAPSSSCAGFLVNEYDEGVVSVIVGDSAVSISAGQELGTIKFKPVSGKSLDNLNNSTFTIDNTEEMFWSTSGDNIDCNDTLTVKAGSSKEEIPATVNKLAALVDGDVEWIFTDAEAYTVSATGFTKDTYSLVKCDLAIDSTAGAKTGSVEVPINISGGTVTFRALIVGIPDGVTINSVTGVITAE